MIVLRSLALYGKLFFGFKSKALYLNKIEFMKMAKESEEETLEDEVIDAFYKLGNDIRKVGKETYVRSLKGILFEEASKYLNKNKDKETHEIKWENDEQIKKLYAAVGWDDDEQQYTGETQPVKWTRIHNLPDFVYYNHSQHVTVAGLECQICHGPVEEMEVVYQYSPLTMNWCLECHKKTNIKTEGNAYYTKIHEELSKKYDLDKFTVRDNGGLECGKCHY